MSEAFNPATHVMGANGPVEIKVSPMTFIAVGAHDQAKTALAAAMEKAMLDAAAAAHSQGITDPNVVKARILMARDKIIDNG